MMKEATVVEARAKAFAGENVKSHRFAVSTDGSVRVWDAIAGHYTNCNSLSESAKARIRKLASGNAPRG